MKLTHRIRMLQITLSANRLIARARNAHENRPHVQSHHMIGAPVPMQPSDYEITARYVLFLLTLCFVIGLINGLLEEKPTYSCTPTKADLRRLT